MSAWLWIILAASALGAPAGKTSGGLDVWEVGGQIWSARLPERHRREKAKRACARQRFRGLRLRLPTAEDFQALEKSGLRHELPEMKDFFYWTSTAHPQAPNVRQLFNGSTGELNWVIYNNIFYESVRCVTNLSRKP